VLRVALEDDHWAYFLQWHQREPSGLCVDLAAEVAAALGVSPVYLPLPWGEGDDGSISGILEGSSWGSFDIIASAVTITPERGAWVHFSEPYALVGQMVLLHRGSQRILSLESLQGRKVGFPRDTTSEGAARSLSSRNEMVPLENASVTLQALEEGLVDVVVIDSPLAFLFLKDHPETQVLDKLLTRESYALVLPLSSDPELRSLVDRVVLEQREILQSRWIP
jgi:ABC-type amino acid transport substrate-binding protein